MWSPQRYIREGIARHRNQELLSRAVKQIERLTLHVPPLPAILTLRHLAARTGTSYEELRNLVANRSQAYRNFHIRKRSGGHRFINVPEPSLMHVQRWVTAHVLKPLPRHPSSFAFTKNASVYRCALEHCNARWLIKLDVTGFFGSISEIQVYRVFKELGYQPLVAFELARLSTYAPARSDRYFHSEWRARSGYLITAYSTNRIGFLPQGAPTSPMLSNLIMKGIDTELTAIAASMGLIYTRYSDDLTFSTRGAFSREKARRLIWSIKHAIAKIGLRLNDRKTIVVPPGARKIVLGLLVDGTEPRLTRQFKSLLRQHLHYLEKYGPREHATRRKFDTIWGMYRHIKGLIDFANMIEPQYAQTVLARFHAVSWPAFS